MIRFVRPALGLAVLMATALPAQNTVRWNDLMASLDEVSDEPPAVRVWLDQRIYRYGEPVRIGYRVEEDAFVVVGRVDFDGNLTVLYPSGKNRVTSVSGGTDNWVRSARMGTRAAFVANGRAGSTGYVFAIASRAPLDVSRLSQRDFSAWVTGVNVGQPMTRYIGDPYRVIQRFARLVLYNPNAEWDYDMEFYSVDQPMYVSSAYTGYGANCGYGSGLYAPGGWNVNGNSLLDDGYGFSSGYGQGVCGNYRYMSCYNAFWAYGSFLPVFCGNGNGGQVVTGPPPPPVRPDTGDSATVNPWVPDSVTRPNVDKAPNGAVNGPHVMTVDGSRPNPVNGWRAEDDLSFSIPARALRGNRTRDRDGSTDISRSPGSTGSSGPMPMPVRPTPEVGNTQPQIDWVRPPRSLEPNSRGESDRMPSRPGSRRDQAEDRGNGRGGGAMPDWNPPPRASSPIFDREPSRGNSSGFTNPPPSRDFNPGSGGGGFNPPGGLDSRPPSPPGIESRPSPSIQQSSPPPSPPPPAPAASSSGAKSADPPEKKPN
ncbi:MAG: DUF4384 domain-containing protein [Cytophagaceae bacterium]|nr:DUF4384 domain-containing protein [Gemmatimonadaceae bacterium]